MSDEAKSVLVCAPVPPEHVPLMWPKALPHVTRAERTAGGRMSIPSLYQSVSSGGHLLWIVFDTNLNAVIAAFTTRVARYPDMNAMVIEWMGGTRMAEWLGMAHDHIKAHAKLNDCTRLEATGRNAWIRWAQRVGWEPEYVQYKMEV
jgi:hypothetical protein